MAKIKGTQTNDLSGSRVGSLTVISFAGKTGGRTQWLCACDCGKKHIVKSYHLVSGQVQSCGDDAHRIKHGLSRCRNKTYEAWCAMRQRCSYNGNAGFRKHYIGRGIKVCERWQKFGNFLSDIGERPDGTSLDRIDNDGDYTPGNCRWATPDQQARNKRTNVQFTAFGETKCVMDWLRQFNISRTSFMRRLNRGMSVEEALTAPKLPGYRTDLSEIARDKEANREHV